MAIDNNNKDIEKDFPSYKATDCCSRPDEELPVSEIKTELGEIGFALKANNSLLKFIKSAIEERLEYDAVKEKAFNKLYDDMMRERDLSNILDRNIKPVLTDLLLLYDLMNEFEALLIEQHNTINDNISKNFQFILSDLLGILGRQEVIPIADDGLGKFNPKLNKPIKSEITDNQSEDFKIVNIVRQGFLWRDKVLRPQEVVINRFEAKDD